MKSISRSSSHSPFLNQKTVTKALNNTGLRIFTFHGQLGKGIILMSVLNILIAASFWSGIVVLLWSLS